MNTYIIFCIMPTESTNDWRDGYGDFINYRTRSVDVVDAATEKAALKRFKNTRQVTYYAEQLSEDDI